MENEFNKKKIDLLRSIMTNPKLSKSFKDALNAPIGSTKREQAKSIFSIMKKIGGTNGQGGYYGQGGPYNAIGAGTTQPSYTIGGGAPQPGFSFPTPKPETDYDNMVIFPAAPRLRAAFSGISGPMTKIPEPQREPLFDRSALTASPFPGLGEASTFSLGGQQYPSLPSFPKIEIKSPMDRGQDIRDIISGYKGLQTSLQTPIEGGVPGVSTAIQTRPEVTAERVAPPVVTDTRIPPVVRPTVKAPLTEADRVRAAAKAAVAETTGAGFFAKNVVDEKFGGSLDAYINAFDEKLQAEFDLTGLETELSNLKAQKQNLIPTMQNYIRGKDQYLRFIDQMIDRTEGTRLTRDMGDPTEAASYKKHLDYLYTLKGRQTQRYGNFLNSAIADYNADLERTQSNYNNVYKQYNDILTRKTSIAQTEYNALYAAMSDMYTSLEDAPMRRATLDALETQNAKNLLDIIKINSDMSSGTNPDYLKNVKTYSDHITDEDGGLNLATLGAGGLVGFFEEISYSEGDPQAGIKAVNTAIANSILNDPGNMEQIQDFKDIVATLSLMEGGDQIAAGITPSLNQASRGLISEYILNNLGDIEDATKGLVKGGLLRTRGLDNKEKWLKKNDNLDENILNDLFELTSNATSSGTYAEDPSQFVTDWFSGDDREVAERVAADLISSW